MNEERREDLLKEFEEYEEYEEFEDDEDERLYKSRHLGKGWCAVVCLLGILLLGMIFINFNIVNEYEDKLSSINAELEESKAEASKMEIEKIQQRAEETKQEVAKKKKTTAKEETAEATINQVKESKTEKDKIEAKATKSDEQARKQQEKKQAEKYAEGCKAASTIFSLREKMEGVYKGNLITKEEMQKYFENYLNILNLSYANKEISKELIDNYHNSFKFSFIDYENYQLKSDEDYLRGLKETVQVYAYNQMIHYYHDNGKLSDETFEAYCTFADPITYSTNEDDLNKIIDLGRRSIKNIGDPDKLLAEGEWRKYRTVSDIDKIK